MDHHVEIWLPVVSFETTHEVSNRGQVRTLDRVTVDKNGRQRRLRSKVLTPIVTYGYQVVNLNRPGVQRTWHVHRIVGEAFHGLRPAGAITRHLNGNRLDNRAENLAWGTPMENSEDMLQHGRSYWKNRSECKNKHEYTPENTRIETRDNGRTHRRCLQCQRDTMARYLQRRREARTA